MGALFNVLILGFIIEALSLQSPKLKICWIHIEKTSSWIGDMLVKIHCPQVWESKKLKDGFAFDIVNWRNMSCDAEFCPEAFGYHDGYHRKMKPSRIVTMLRDPINRTISGYTFGSRGRDRSTFWKPLLLKYGGIIPIPDIYEIQDYARLPGMQGCQTKVLTGKRCYDEHDNSESDIAEALRVLREEVSFFGLTEEPKLSRQLYLKMFGEETAGFESYSKHSPQLIHYRKSKLSAEAHQRLSRNLTASGWRDEADERLYAEARKLFFENCRKYQLSNFVP